MSGSIFIIIKYYFSTRLPTQRDRSKTTLTKRGGSTNCQLKVKNGPNLVIVAFERPTKRKKVVKTWVGYKTPFQKLAIKSSKL